MHEQVVLFRPRVVTDSGSPQEAWDRKAAEPNVQILSALA